MSLLDNLLCNKDYFLGGIDQRSSSFAELFAAVTNWGDLLGRSADEIVAVLEPCLRQSILMSLLPAKVFDPNFNGSIDAAVIEHATSIQIALTPPQVEVLRNVCIHVAKLRDLNSNQARAQSASMATLRARPALLSAIRRRQGDRCVWCGVPLNDPSIVESLDHVAPKHLGDDIPDGANWAIACLSCNAGKGDNLAWSSAREAHDYLGRTQFTSSQTIDLKHRIAVLMRTRRCEFCQATSNQAEIVVYRRVPTGLPIPANCGATCRSCGTARSLEILTPLWDAKEASRN